MTTRQIVLGLAAAAAIALSGCPEPVQVPTPDGGRVCTANEDCNPGVTCGALYLCVQELCEATPSQVVPCR